MALATFRRLIRSCPSAWLLAAVLWLPAAQWAATAHALLHVRAALAGDVERPAHLPTPCDTCVVAATIGGAAPSADRPALPVAALPQSRAADPLAPAPTLAFSAAYRSRAPPLPHA